MSFKQKNIICYVSIEVEQGSKICQASTKLNKSMLQAWFKILIPYCVARLKVGKLSLEHITLTFIPEFKTYYMHTPSLVYPYINLP